MRIFFPHFILFYSLQFFEPLLHFSGFFLPLFFSRFPFSSVDLLRNRERPLPHHTRKFNSPSLTFFPLVKRKSTRTGVGGCEFSLVGALNPRGLRIFKRRILMCTFLDLRRHRSSGYIYLTALLVYRRREFATRAALRYHKKKEAKGKKEKIAIMIHKGK